LVIIKNIDVLFLEDEHISSVKTL